MTHSRYKTTFNREKIIRLLIIAIIVLSALFVFIMRTGDNNIKLDKSDIKSEEQISEKTADDQGTETSSDVVICDVSGAAVVVCSVVLSGAAVAAAVVVDAGVFPPQPASASAHIAVLSAAAMIFFSFILLPPDFFFYVKQLSVLSVIFFALHPLK